MTIEVAPLESLIFVYQAGCSACEAAMPELDKFAAENPRLMIVKIKADGPHVLSLTGIKRLQATPTYVFRRGYDGVTHIGALKAKEIEKWMRAVINANGDEGDEG